jgi:hypothetical protein
MDATWIITAFVVIDTLMERLNHHSDVRAKVPDSEVILIAVVSAKYKRTITNGRSASCAKPAICPVGLM